jgi:hypothetical protein
MPIDRSKWYNMWGNLIAGIKPYKNPNNWPRTSIVDDWDGTIQSLNCGSFTNYGTLVALKPVSASSSVSYAGGNGGSYPTQTVNSTGVTGLNAKLQSGFFLLSSGTLTYTISGTPSTSGTASFAIQVGGKSCTLRRVVEQQLVAPPNAFILKAQLLTGDIIDGRIGSSEGYYRILYWDGTSEILPSWTTFQKTNTSVPDGTMNSYGPKLIKIWSCDVNGNVNTGMMPGYISSIELTNNKYLEFSLDKVTQLKYLTIKNNTVITTSDLNFSLLTNIEHITLENLQSFTGVMSLTNIPNWQQPSFIKLDGTITSNRSEWNSPHYVTKLLNITNLPITSLDLGGHDGVTMLQLSNCTNLTNINSTGCENLDNIDLRNNAALVSTDLQLPYLDTIIILDSPNYSSSIMQLPNNLKRLFLENVGVSAINLLNLTSLTDLSLKDMSQLDITPSIFDTTISTFHSNTNLWNSLERLYLVNINWPYIDLASFGELFTIELKQLDITSFNLPYSAKDVDIYRLTSVTPTEVDSLLTGLDASGVVNGSLTRTKYSTNDLLRTHASDTALTNLISKGWSLYGFNVTQL